MQSLLCKRSSGVHSQAETRRTRGWTLRHGLQDARRREVQRAAAGGGRGRRVHGLSGRVFVHAWRGSSQDGHRISPLKVHHRRGVVPCPSRSPPISSPPSYVSQLPLSPSFPSCASFSTQHSLSSWLHSPTPLPPPVHHFPLKMASNAPINGIKVSCTSIFSPCLCHHCSAPHPPSRPCHFPTSIFGRPRALPFPSHSASISLSFSLSSLATPSINVIRT